MSNAELKQRLQRICLAILGAGLCGAMLIYLFATEVPDDSVGYVVANGAIYSVSPGDSKKYQREVERFGGKAAVLFDDFNRWFAGLWDGKALAHTVAWISMLLSLGIYLYSASLQPDAQAQKEDTRKHDESS